MEAFHDDILADLNGFELGEVVELITVDATGIGGDVYRLTPSPVEGAGGVMVAPTFGGNAYQVVPFESEGWDFSAGGTLPQPTVCFGIAREDGDALAVATWFLSLLASLDDLLGARVLRLRTLRKYLDDGSDPNPQAHMGVEVYTIARKTSQTATQIEFLLQSALDLEGVVLPRRQVLNFCQWSYRRPAAGGGFDYGDATCPYAGAARFDANGVAVTTDSDDACGKRLSDCKKRFGAQAVLPYGGFPGAGKFARG